MTGVWDKEDEAQERALIALEHPDWTPGRVHAELKKRILQPIRSVADPDRLCFTDIPLTERDVPNKQEILARAEKLHSSIYAHLIGEKTVRQVAKDLQISLATAHARIQSAKRQLRKV